jgi:hypothetical protein
MSWNLLRPLLDLISVVPSTQGRSGTPRNRRLLLPADSGSAPTASFAAGHDDILAVLLLHVVRVAAMLQDGAKTGPFRSGLIPLAM